MYEFVFGSYWMSFIFHSVCGLLYLFQPGIPSVLHNDVVNLEVFDYAGILNFFQLEEVDVTLRICSKIVGLFMFAICWFLWTDFNHTFFDNSACYALTHAMYLCLAITGYNIYVPKAYRILTISFHFIIMLAMLKIKRVRPFPVGELAGDDDDTEKDEDEEEDPDYEPYEEEEEESDNEDEDEEVSNEMEDSDQ